MRATADSLHLAIKQLGVGNLSSTTTGFGGGGSCERWTASTDRTASTVLTCLEKRAVELGFLRRRSTGLNQRVRLAFFMLMFSSGVLWLLGSDAHRLHLARDRISRHRAPVKAVIKTKPAFFKEYVAAHSSASGAPVSLSLALISAWPVFHISGLPPAARIASPSSRREHFTSKMMSAPGQRLSTSW